MAVDRDEQGDAVVIPTALGNVPLQVTRWSGKRESKTLSGTSQEIVLPTGSKVIEIMSEQNCYIRFGGSGVEATTVIADDGSRFFVLGVQVIPVPLDPASGVEYTHVAVIWQSTAGIFQVEKLQ